MFGLAVVGTPNEWRLASRRRRESVSRTSARRAQSELVRSDLPVMTRQSCCRECPRAARGLACSFAARSGVAQCVCRLGSSGTPLATRSSFSASVDIRCVNYSF
jgi:hypothetical protein